MKGLSIPFSLFDFFAVLLPGALCLFGIYLFMNPALTQTGHDTVFSAKILLRFTGDIALITVIVLASYLLGQVLNALSEIMIDRPANRFLGAHIVGDLHHHNVKKAIQKKFGDEILQQSDRRTFIMVESTVGANMPDAAATARRFIALAVMFQSLALGLLVVGVALIMGYASKEAFTGSFVSLALVVVLILSMAIIMLWSYRRYKRMWSQTLCMSFVAWASLGKNTEA